MIATCLNDVGVVPIRKYPGTVTVLEPIHHGGDEKTGSTPVLRSIAQWDDDAGELVKVPFISGNSVRGRLRDMVFDDLLQSLDYKVESKKLYHALFTGGVLEKGGGDETDDDLEFRRWCRDLFPPIALLGTSLQNQILSSCLKVGHLRLLCLENVSLLPNSLKVDERCRKSYREFTDISFATRMDDLRANREEGEQATQMKIEFEVFIAGSQFAHSFALENANELEASCLAHVVWLWQQNPILGAKSASGYGTVAPSYENLPDPSAYRNYVHDNANELRAGLDKLAQRLEKSAKTAKSKPAMDDDGE